MELLFLFRVECQWQIRWHSAGSFIKNSIFVRAFDFDITELPEQPKYRKIINIVCVSFFFFRGVISSRSVTFIYKQSDICSAQTDMLGKRCCFDIKLPGQSKYRERIFVIKIACVSSSSSSSSSSVELAYWVKYFLSMVRLQLCNFFSFRVRWVLFLKKTILGMNRKLDGFNF